MKRIGIVAGEPSGDNLGAELINTIKEVYPDVIVEGIGGPKLIAAGCQSMFDMERLSVMGLFEILGRYFELLSMQRQIKHHFRQHPPDVFIGIDSPDFTLSIEKTLRALGVKTVHYVSPSVWAWREKRLDTIRRSTDLMLTLFPFEERYYHDKDIPVRFVGHPLANEIPMHSDKVSAREALGLPVNEPTLALLPGSRSGEISRLTEPFLKAAKSCQEAIPNLKIISGLHNDRAAELFATHAEENIQQGDVSVFTGQTRAVLAAADVVLLASGTATLETLLVKRPMVVGYKANWLTYLIIKPLLRVPYVSLPNLIAGKKLVPEYLQHECEPEVLATACLNYLKNSDQVTLLEKTFEGLHQQLMTQQAGAAGRAVLSLLESTSDA